MKKFAILTLAFALGASLLAGCGCMNTGADVTTLPTNGETASPATLPATAPTTMPTTVPTTEVPGDTIPDTTGTLEGAMDDVVGGTADNTTVPDVGRSRTYGNGPRMK